MITPVPTTTHDVCTHETTEQENFLSSLHPLWNGQNDNNRKEIERAYCAAPLSGARMSIVYRPDTTNIVRQHPNVHISPEDKSGLNGLAFSIVGLSPGSRACRQNDISRKDKRAMSPANIPIITVISDMVQHTPNMMFFTYRACKLHAMNCVSCSH